MCSTPINHILEQLDLLRELHACGLQREVLVLRGDLETSAAKLQQKTRETVEQRVEAEKVLQAARVECKAKVGIVTWASDRSVTVLRLA